MLKSDPDNHFDSKKSSVVLWGSSEYFRGVEFDSKRKVLERAGFILVPVCIDKEADEGLWLLEITTDNMTGDGVSREVIEAVFTVGRSDEKTFLDGR